MSILSSDWGNVPHCRGPTSLDDAAEREAIALARFAIIADVPTEPDRRIELGRQMELAKRLGIKPCPHPRYPRLKVIRRWEKICRAVQLRQPIRRPTELPLTVFDRERRAAKRANRLEAMKRLLALSENRSLSMSEAAQLAGYSKRVLQRAAQQGKLEARKAFIRREKNMPGRGEYQLTIADLRQFLTSRTAA